jgi:hypothetical protein
MMNEYTGSDVTTKLHEEQWLSQLQKTAGKKRKTSKRRAQRRLQHMAL